MMPVVGMEYRTICVEAKDQECERKRAECLGKLRGMCNRRAWAGVCSQVDRHCGRCRECKVEPIQVERLVPTEVEKITCGVGGPGGPVHDGRGSRKEYHVNIQGGK